MKVDGAEPQRLSDALGALPCVLFSPADVELVAGAPSARRRYLDILLALIVAAVSRGAAALPRRARAAERRAARRAARRGRGRAEQRVAVWEAPLAEHGAVLWRERVRGTERARERFAELCAAIGEQTPVAMRYATVARAVEHRARRRRAHARAIAGAEARARHAPRAHAQRAASRRSRRSTLDGRELRAFGSAGQQRTAAIALRLLEAETLQRATRRARRSFCSTIRSPSSTRAARRTSSSCSPRSGMGQTLLTVPRESDIPPALTRLARWRIAGGRRQRRDAQVQRESGAQEASSARRRAGGLLSDSGLAERVEQAGVIPEWPSLVGPQIAAVTEPMSIAADGTMFVHVTTNAWMNELSLMEPELLRALNAKDGRRAGAADPLAAAPGLAVGGFEWRVRDEM